MSQLAIVCFSLVGFALVALHIMQVWASIRDDDARRAEIDRVRKELEDETLHGGNIARIALLRKRLQELRFED